MAASSSASPILDLEHFITSSFSDLSLEVPSDDVEYIARLVEEEELEDEDKKEGVKGMVEMYMDVSEGLVRDLGEIRDRWFLTC